MMGNEKDEIIEKNFESYLQNIFTKYKKDLKEAMRGSKFVSIVLPTSKNRLEMRRIKYRFSWMVEKYKNNDKSQKMMMIVVLSML